MDSQLCPSYPCVLAAAVIVVVVAPFVLRRQSCPYGGVSSPYPTEIDIDGGRDTDEDRDTGSTTSQLPIHVTYYICTYSAADV